MGISRTMRSASSFDAASIMHTKARSPTGKPADWPYPPPPDWVPPITGPELAARRSWHRLTKFQLVPSAGRLMPDRPAGSPRPQFSAAVAAGSPTGFWRMSGHPAVQQALRNHYFDSLGLPRLHVSAQA